VSLPRAIGLVALGAAGCGPSGHPPELAPLESQVVAVNEQLVLVLVATDPDGDAIDYSFESDVPDLDGRAVVTTLPQGAGEFQWTPLAADIGSWRFDFSASDGQNDDRATIRIDVKPATGESSAPRFLHPEGEGTTLELGSASCLSLPVEVADDDSTEVTLEQLPPLIDGAVLTQTGPLGATWSWCPSAAEIAASDRYTVVFGADDGDNPVVEDPYLIVLLGGG
jgi:hypothetical protein